MARTMGEVLPRSFPDLFGSVYGSTQSNSVDGVDGVADSAGNRKNHRVLFVDVGSGYGTLCHAAVAEYGCVASLGIEKYR